MLALLQEMADGAAQRRDRAAEGDEDGDGGLAQASISHVLDVRLLLDEPGDRYGLGVEEGHQQGDEDQLACAVEEEAARVAGQRVELQEVRKAAQTMRINPSRPSSL